MSHFISNEIYVLASMHERRCGEMKQAIEGFYADGKVTLNEQVPVKGKSKVLVVFLEDYQEKADRKRRLMGTFGTWEDNRNADDIINEIHSSRASRKEEISL